MVRVVRSAMDHSLRGLTPLGSPVGLFSRAEADIVTKFLLGQVGFQAEDAQLLDQLDEGTDLGPGLVGRQGLVEYGLGEELVLDALERLADTGGVNARPRCLW